MEKPDMVVCVGAYFVKNKVTKIRKAERGIACF